MTENEISKIVLDCAFKVHKTLGLGLLESAYEECLCYELSKNNIQFERQKSLPVIYDDLKLDCGYRIDIYIDEKVIVELKVVDNFTDIHTAQLLTYLKLSECKLGLLINFNSVLLKDGIKRIVNNL